MKFLLILLLFAPFSSHALEFDENELIIHKGWNKALDVDEAYLYLVFKSNTDLRYISIDHVESGRQLRFNHVTAGEHHALIKIKAGEYYFKRIKKEVAYWSYSFSFDKDDYTFQVKPGVVNYVGNWSLDLNFDSSSRATATLKNINRTAYENIHYQKNYKHLVNNQNFIYQGKVKDGYLPEINRLITQYKLPKLDDIDFHTDSLIDKNITTFETENGVKKQLTRYPELGLYLNGNHKIVSNMSPDGQFILLNTKTADKFQIEIIDTQSLRSYIVFSQQLHKNSRIKNLKWIDNNSFTYSLTFYDIDSIHVVHLETDKENTLTKAHQIELPMQGEIINPLINQDNKFLLAHYSYSNSSDKTQGVYLVDVSNEKSVETSLRRRMKQTQKFKNVIRWLTDLSGNLRIAIEIDYDKKEELARYHYWYLADPATKDWRKIAESTSNDKTPLPLALSEDGRFLYAISDQYGDRHSLHKYSTQDFSHIGPFSEIMDFDTEGVIFDQKTNQPTAYIYTEDGINRIKYIHSENTDIDHIKTQNPHLNLYFLEKNETHGLVLIFGTSRFSKGAWYLHREGKGDIIKIAEFNTEYESLPKGDTYTIKIKADDGVDIEGYLVKPSNKNIQKPPLVVLPHGGPIGARDYASNDELQHFFAAKGIATLKVNYRGSFGYGKAFQDLGNGEWGEKIESDINTMTKHAIKQHQLNNHKVCAMGASYGGYSSIMLTLLYPDLFQCAVSYAGVTDLPLMFTGISASYDKDYQSQMMEIVGNPHINQEKMMQKSPFYLAEKITKPIKLFHGINDDTVSLEQSFRLFQAAIITGLDMNLTILANEAHSLHYINSKIYYWAESLNFINNVFIKLDEQQ